jgi:hypothetical protein
MKQPFLIIILCIYFSILGAQTTFSYSPVEPKNNIILDAIIENETVYALQISFDTLKSTELLVLNTQGNLLTRSELGDTPFNAMRFLKITGQDIFLLGRFKTDICESTIATVKYNMLSKELSVLSEIPLCDKNVQNLRLADKLDSGWFINGYYVSQGFETFLLEMDTTFNLQLLMDSLGHQQVSIDFSRNGYVLKTNNLCNFYDRNFTYRKQRYNFEDGSFSIHQTHIPYGDHYILESYSASPEYMNTGQYIRLIDSALHIKKEVFVAPGTPNTSGISEPPFFGGIDFISESSLWLAGNNNISSSLSIPNHFSISRINDNLELDCNQYIGFDAAYVIYGIRASLDGGVLVYGIKFNGSYDPYIIKLGPNCELPTTSTIDSDLPLISISAYPNPGINKISFSVQGFDPSTLRVEFIDVPGQVVFAAKDLSNRMEVADLPAGQYFYRILQGDRLLGVGAWVKQ